MDDLKHTYAETHASRRRAALAGALVVIGALVLPATTAGADGGRGRSFCSESNGPTGEFAGDTSEGSTYGNAGEVISWFSKQGIRPGPWGHTVTRFCHPRTS
jgi:hypothetical protein